jgi:hypothetical protein
VIATIAATSALGLGRLLRPGQRIIAGRAFYSAAWLDQATSTFPDPLSGMLARVDVPDARYAGRVAKSAFSWRADGALEFGWRLPARAGFRAENRQH